MLAAEMPPYQHIKIGIEPKHLVIISQPYVVFTVRGYQPIVNVIERKTKREYFLYISARSVAVPLEQLRIENDGKFVGIEFWIRKQGLERNSKYIIED